MFLNVWLTINQHWLVNSLWPSDAIWPQRSGSTLAQVMACCLMAPSHYLNQCWLIFILVPWHSSEDIIIKDLRIPINKKRLKIAHLKLNPDLPGANELMARCNQTTNNYIQCTKAMTGEGWYVASNYTNGDTTVYQLPTIKPLIVGTSNPKTKMFIISSCSCLCLIENRC